MIHRFLLLLLAASTAALASSPPNVIILFADDQGYQDLSCFGSKTIQTPNIDRIASEGCRFTSFYSAFAACSASRASLLTGCYHPRISMPAVIWPKSKTALSPEETTLAEVLKPLGYATQCVGKWHVGDHPETLPTNQGFDHYFGYPYSNDMNRTVEYVRTPEGLDRLWRERNWKVYNGELYRDETVIEQPVNQITMTDRYGDECVRFIESNKDRPFFLYYANSMPHVPLFVSDDHYDPDPALAYKLTIEHIDAVVGRILETLDKHGLSDNTLVVYTSDNGPWLKKKHHGGSALPLRDGKGATYEGGMRVPCVMRLPGTIPAATTCDQVVSTIDLLPTIAALTGGKRPERKIDGLDISSLLRDPRSGSPRNEVGFMYYNYSHTPDAIRVGPWKLRITKHKKGKQTKIELYHLERDISESENLAPKHPEIVGRLKARMLEIDRELQANKREPWRADP